MAGLLKVNGFIERKSGLCLAKKVHPNPGEQYLRCGRPEHGDDIHAAYDTGGWTHPTSFLTSWRRGE